MSANRLHVSNLSTSLLSWPDSSASQTVRRSLRVSVRMRTRSTEGIQTNGWKPRYETFIVVVTCIIWWKRVNMQPNHRPVCLLSLGLLSPDGGFWGGQWRGHWLLLWWRDSFPTKEEKSFSRPEVRPQDYKGPHVHVFLKRQRCVNKAFC